MGKATTLTTRRLALVPLDAALLAAVAAGDRAAAPFTWPAWWPDEVDREHVARWRDRAPGFEGGDDWGPRALIDGEGRMVGHAGFHLPPRPLDEALADPSFSGELEPAAGGVVEIGYTVFPEHRRRGYATEAVAALVDWAFDTGEVTTVVATVAPDNVPSLAVLDRAGFRPIGTCADGSGAQELVYRRDRGR